MGRRTQWALALLFSLAVTTAPAGLAAQDVGAASAEVSFASVEACQALAEGLTAAAEKAKELDGVLPETVETREALASAIFQGTQIVLAFGEQMFAATDAHEETCKAALRDGGKPEEIARVYELVVDPTLKAYRFFVWVRDSAKGLEDTQTVEEMNQAIDGYKTASFKLIDFCEQDLPNELGTAPCGELRKRLAKAMP